MKRTTESQLRHDARRKEKLMERMQNTRAERAKNLTLDAFNKTPEEIYQMGYNGPNDSTLMAGFYVRNSSKFINHKKYNDYLIDYDGNVYHLTSFGRVLKIKPVWLSAKAKSYMVINVRKNKIPYTMTLHRFIYETFHRIDQLPPHKDIHHIDFNPLNNDPFNLCIMDESEHMSIHGKLNKGKKYKKEEK